MPGTMLEIDWKTILLGGESWGFLPEAAFRSVIMFLVILFSLRLLGKRGVKQLSVFELGVIIGLGSAAGDPMFYKDVGLLPGMVVFCMIIAMYKLVTYIINRSEKFEKFIEGQPTYIIQNGMMVLENFEKEPIARDELYMQMRLNKISHLGQVEHAILENNGELSFTYYANEDIRPGLPILPHLCGHKLASIRKEDYYSCTNCGHTEKLKSDTAHCDQCEKNEWVKSVDFKRVS